MRLVHFGRRADLANGSKRGYNDSGTATDWTFIVCATTSSEVGKSKEVGKSNVLEESYEKVLDVQFGPWSYHRHTCVLSPHTGRCSSAWTERDWTLYGAGFNLCRY
jgi:hypothetical protein